MQAPTNETSHPAPAVAAAAASYVSPSPSPSQDLKRKNPCSGFDDESERGPPPLSGQEKAKSYDEVKEEVRQMTYALMGSDEAAKLQTLKVLADLRCGTKEQCIRAVGDWGCCHLVLIALHHELAKEAGSSRDVVHQAIRFLARWNKHSAKQRDDTSTCRGIESLVKAMKAYPQDSGIQYAAICWLLHYSRDKDEKRLREVFDGDVVPRIVQAMNTFPDDKDVVLSCIKTLDRLCDAASQGHWLHLVKAGTILALAVPIMAYWESDEQIQKAAKAVVMKFCSA